MIIVSDESIFDVDIKNMVDLKLSLEVITHALPNKTKEYISLTLSKYLDEAGLADCYNKLDYCLSEILFNAIKANLKRVYFKEKNLDITNKADYDEGMKTFRIDTLENKEHYLNLLCEQDLYVKFLLKVEGEDLVLEVRNNAVITDFEYKRVKEKISQFHNVTPEDLFANCIDETEGAGLGINSILLTLKSFGLPGDNYQIFIEGNETVARLVYSVPSI